MPAQSDKSKSVAARQMVLDSVADTWVPAVGTSAGQPIISLAGAGLINNLTYDYAAQTQAATTDTWTFKTGGSGGTTVAVIVITYTDSGKATISNVERTT